MEEYIWILHRSSMIFNNPNSVTDVQLLLLSLPLEICQHLLKGVKPKCIESKKYYLYGIPNISCLDYETLLFSARYWFNLKFSISSILVILFSLCQHIAIVSLKCPYLQVLHLITFYLPLWGAILYNGFTYYEVNRMLNNATRVSTLSLNSSHLYIGGHENLHCKSGKFCYFSLYALNFKKLMEFFCRWLLA